MAPSADPYAQARQLADGLYPHQAEGVAFLLGRRRALLADDMGLGKTRQAIVALRHQLPKGPCLVVCPASLKHNWQREIEIVEPQASIHIIGPAAPPDADYDGWVIVNYDLLNKHHDALAVIPWRGFVFDEAHYLKNHTSQRSRLSRRLLQACPEDPVVYALTGTPLTNRPRDLFVLLQILNHSIGRSFISFAKRYCAAHHNGYGWVTDGASNLEDLTLELQGTMLRRRKEEVLDLPPKTRRWVGIDVPPTTAQKSTETMVHLLLRAQKEQGQAAAPSVERDRTRLIAHVTRIRRTLAVAKTKATIDLVGNAVEQGEKVLVFSCFDEPLQKIYQHFGDAAVLVTGATPTHKRQDLVDRFQQEEGVQVFAANILAGGVGLNLTAARQVVFNDLDWVPANHWQAEDRAYRIGQIGTVHVSYMVALGTLDEFVQSALEAKAALVQGVVEGQALSPEINRDILSELEQAIARLSPQLADTADQEWTPDQLRDLLQQAGSEYPQEITRVTPNAEDLSPEITDEILKILADVLNADRGSTYRVQSNSSKGKFYEVYAEGADVTCTCRGFEYRGMCSHARTLKAVLSNRGDLPEGWVQQ